MTTPRSGSSPCACSSAWGSRSWARRTPSRRPVWPGEQAIYVNSPFKVPPATALAFAAARGFGLVIACDGGRPVAAHLPFRLIEADGKGPKLEFHVARPNPLGQIAEKGGTWLVAVQGHDAYVSPDGYASADQVPTWLYEA